MNALTLPQMFRGFIVISTFYSLAIAPQPATAQQTKKASTATPPEVLAQMKAGVRSLGVLHFPAKKGTPLLLVHAWVEDSPLLAAAQIASEDDKRWFHLDFFTLKNSKWQLSQPVTYLSDRPEPDFGNPAWGSCQWLWLNSKTQKGLVIVVRINGPVEGSAWVITLPQGVPLNSRDAESPYDVRKFYESFAGGGSTTHVTFGAEADGTMAVISDARFSSGGRERTIYGRRESSWEEIRKFSNSAEMRKERERTLSRQK